MTPAFLCAVQGQEEFYPASSSAMPDSPVSPEVQALTDNPLYGRSAMSETEPRSVAQLHKMSQGPSQANVSSPKAEANKGWLARLGLS